MINSTLDMLCEKMSHIEARLSALEESIRGVHKLASPWAVPLGDGKLLVHTLHSMIMVVNAVDRVITPQLIVYRQWEADLTRLLFNSFRSHTVFVDVGANIGYFTLLAASRIGAAGTGRVIAIEPNPHCLDLLHHSLAINWSLCNVNVHAVAAAAAEGEGWLAGPPDREANGHLAYDYDKEGEHRLPISLKPLDALVPEGLAVDILKIDVEGFELGVLQGAQRVISQSPHIKIIMEWSPEQMQDAGVSPLVMAYRLKSLGLIVRSLPRSDTLEHLREEDAPQISFEDLAQMNYGNILITKRT